MIEPFDKKRPAANYAESLNKHAQILSKTLHRTAFSERPYMFLMFGRTRRFPRKKQGRTIRCLSPSVLCRRRRFPASRSPKHGLSPGQTRERFLPTAAAPTTIGQATPIRRHRSDDSAHLLVVDGVLNLVGPSPLLWSGKGAAASIGMTCGGACSFSSNSSMYLPSQVRMSSGRIGLALRMPRAIRSPDRDWSTVCRAGSDSVTAKNVMTTQYRDALGQPEDGRVAGRTP